MRALATGLLTFLILIQSSMPHAQGWGQGNKPTSVFLSWEHGRETLTHAGTLQQPMQQAQGSDN